MNKKTLFWIGIYAIAAYGGYYYLTKRRRDTKTIVESGNTAATMKFFADKDKGYISEWAKAIRKGYDVFSYKGKIYNTKGGTAKR
jgi:hypothetical protein